MDLISSSSLIKYLCDVSIACSLRVVLYYPKPSKSVGKTGSFGRADSSNRNMVG